MLSAVGINSQVLFLGFENEVSLFSGKRTNKRPVKYYNLFINNYFNN